MRERRDALRRRHPAAAAKGAARGAALSLSRACSRLRRGQGVLHDHGLRAPARVLLKDKHLGKHIVPIVADEARTLVWKVVPQPRHLVAAGQLYTRRTGQLMFYKEDASGQILQKASTRPVRVLMDRGGDRVFDPRRADDPVFHLLLDVRYPAHGISGGRRRLPLARLSARRYLGPHHPERRGPATRGRHSHLATAQIPNCMSYDPTFGYESPSSCTTAAPMYQEQEDIYYYITVMNENYEIRDARGQRGGHTQGHVPLPQAARRRTARAAAGVGSILREVIAAAICSRTTGVWRPTSGAARASRCSRATARVRALEPVESNEAAAFVHVGECLKDTRAR